MYTIIGIGGVGTRIAKNFEKFPQYNIVCLDDEDTGQKHQIVLKKEKTPELYEESFKKIPASVKKVIKDKVVCVVSGASLVSSVVLKFLYELRDREIKIIYIKPESDLLAETKRKQEKVVFSVLQEYARSGLFKDICLISNTNMDVLVEDASIAEYYPTMNSLIANTFHMIMVFDNQNPEVSNFSEIMESRRIYTLGLLDQNSGEEKTFFSIDIPLENRLYYGIVEENLNKNKSLQRNIIKLIKRKNQEFCKYSYAVYGTRYENDFCYMKSYTSKVQDF